MAMAIELLKSFRAPFQIASHTGLQVIADADGHRLCECYHGVTALELMAYLNSTADMFVKEPQS